MLNSTANYSSHGEHWRCRLQLFTAITNPNQSVDYYCTVLMHRTLVVQHTYELHTCTYELHTLTLFQRYGSARHRGQYCEYHETLNLRTGAFP